MKAVLHVISDRHRHRLPLLDCLIEAIRAEADVIQIREKKAPALETYEFIVQLQRILLEQQLQTRIFLNDRLDLAMALQLSGVHLARKSLPIDAARQLCHQIGWYGVIGCSVHSIEEAEQAEQLGVDYVTFGHVYDSESHPGVPSRGVYALHRVVEKLSIPVVAIGGIAAYNLLPVLETGCSGVAVIGAVLDAKNPYLATRQLKTIIQEADIQSKIPFPFIPRETGLA